MRRHLVGLPGSVAVIGREAGEPLQRLPITARRSHQEGSLQRPREHRGATGDPVQSRQVPHQNAEGVFLVFL